MYYKKFLKSLHTWAVFREGDTGDYTIASGLTDEDADRILRELGIGRKFVTVEPPVVGYQHRHTDYRYAAL